MVEDGQKDEAMVNACFGDIGIHWIIIVELVKMEKLFVLTVRLRCQLVSVRWTSAKQLTVLRIMSGNNFAIIRG